MKIAVALTICLSLYSQRSLAWGAYGHEQINSEAISLIKDDPLGACFAKNRDRMVRLAVTPDLDWKMSSQDSFALKVYTVVEELPKDPTNSYLLKKVKEILDNEVKKKAGSRILSDEFVEALGTNPSNPQLLAQLKEKELAEGKLGVFTYEDLKLKKTLDKDEHSLHYWEADAYSKNILDLKSGVNFDRDDLQDYEERAKANAKEIAAIDPCKTPSGLPSRDVIQHGTAPWRIYDLLNTGSALLGEAVKTHDQTKFENALTILGTMGHYVGDMGQPFHATLNYDGQGSGPTTLKIHSSYEEAILERFAKYPNSGQNDVPKTKTGRPKLGKPKTRQDDRTKLWAPFTTEPTVDIYAKTYLRDISPNDLAERDIIPTIFKLVADGYPLIKVLLPAFSAARLADPDYKQLDLPLVECGPKKPGAPKGVNVHSITLDKFLVTKIKVPGIDHPITVVESAEKRMGEASAVLAKLWLTAERLSKIDSAALNDFCPNLQFDSDYATKDFRENVMANYPGILYHQPLSDFDRYPKKEQKLDDSDAQPSDGDVDDPISDGDNSNDADTPPRQPQSVKLKATHSTKKEK